jgi:hypothetical protein
MAHTLSEALAYADDAVRLAVSMRRLEPASWTDSFIAISSRRRTWRRSAVARKWNLVRNDHD